MVQGAALFEGVAGRNHDGAKFCIPVCALQYSYCQFCVRCGTVTRTSASARRCSSAFAVGRTQNSVCGFRCFGMCNSALSLRVLVLRTAAVQFQHGLCIKCMSAYYYFVKILGVLTAAPRFNPDAYPQPRQCTNRSSIKLLQCCESLQ